MPVLTVQRLRVLRSRARRKRPGRARLGVDKLANAARGLWFALQGDRSVAWKVPLLALLLSGSLYLRHWVDVVLIVVTTMVLLAAELFNTALEELCNFVEPRFDSRIGRIKDIAAAAVMLCYLAWLSVITYEVSRLWSATVGG